MKSASLIKSTYELNICGLTRELPLFPVSDKLRIAYLDMLGDTELCEACARELYTQLAPNDYDIILTAELKGIAMASALAHLVKKPYVVARKTKKQFMLDCIESTINTITTGKQETLYLSIAQWSKLQGKNVLIVDDVLSTGGACKALKSLIKQAGGNYYGVAVAVVEDGNNEQYGAFHCARLPVFPIKEG